MLDQSISMLSKKLPVLQVTDRKLSGFERYKDPLKENVVGISFHFKREIFITYLVIQFFIIYINLKYKMKLGTLVSLLIAYLKLYSDFSWISMYLIFTRKTRKVQK